MQFKQWAVKVKVPHFGNLLIRDYLCKLAHTNQSPEYKDGGFEFTFVQANEWAKDQFIKSLEMIFCSDFLSFEVVECEQFNDDWEKYEYLLRGHDWHYAMSDDHRVYMSGLATEREIKKLGIILKAQDEEREMNLWAKYALCKRA